MKNTVSIGQLKIAPAEILEVLTSRPTSPGPIVRISPTEACFQDLSTTREMYRVKGEYRKGKFYDQLANGQVSVFSTRDVDVHKRQRRLLSSEMSESSLQKHLPVVEAKVRLAIQRMQEEMQQRKAADVFHWFLSMATDVIGELSFGKSFDMLETGGVRIASV